MARRLPSVPPVLPGFSYLHILGTGGFADVFLYEQNMPRRQVAVKVMLSEVVNDQVRQMFQAEANLMAQLSAHPGILTVYQAGVSAEGRPYLVMELCSAVLNERYRAERLPVAEVLRIAIKIGSALETVHRAGVLHRDVKPSNILTTSYGNPVLSDFGIAATLQTARDEEAIGLSIPWSSPEVLIDDVPGSVASEVWSYAATVYSLLAGRSPFEVPGGDNGATALMGRIARAHPLPIDRPDVPESLERALRRAMSRRPEQRPGTILELVRELQAIESELGLTQTPVELAVDDWAVGGTFDADDRTRLRPVAVGASGSRAERRRRTRAATGAGAFAVVDAGSLPSRIGASGAPVPLRRRATAWLVGALVTLAVALGAAALVVAVTSSNAGVPRVGDVTATVAADGTIEFTWADPGLAAGDRYQIQVRDGTSSIQTAPRYVVDATPGETVCITVAVNRAGTSGPPSTEKCADVPG
ncbi:MAG: serine/threonine protein kinase [Actinomycetales bacterium]|nr:serine/threonine protein kinase [Actinomycetales bacterium]